MIRFCVRKLEGKSQRWKESFRVSNSKIRNWGLESFDETIIFFFFLFVKLRYHFIISAFIASTGAAPASSFFFFSHANPTKPHEHIFYRGINFLFIFSVRNVDGTRVYHRPNHRDHGQHRPESATDLQAQCGLYLFEAKWKFDFAAQPFNFFFFFSIFDARRPKKEARKRPTIYKLRPMLLFKRISRTSLAQRNYLSTFKMSKQETEIENIECKKRFAG